MYIRNILFKIITKLTLAALLFACCANKLTEYSHLIKIVVSICFVLFAYTEFNADKLLTSALSGISAIILNPFFEIPFLSESWNIIYLLLAIGLVLWVIGDLLNPQQKQKFLE